MTQPWPDWMKRRVGNPSSEPANTRTVNVETTDPAIRKLYAPDGSVLLTVSDRPPVGFHQGQRS